MTSLLFLLFFFYLVHNLSILNPSLFNLSKQVLRIQLCLLSLSIFNDVHSQSFSVDLKSSVKDCELSQRPLLIMSYAIYLSFHIEGNPGISRHQIHIEITRKVVDFTGSHIYFFFKCQWLEGFLHMSFT